MSLRGFIKKCNGGGTPSSEQVSSNLGGEISRHSEEQHLQRESTKFPRPLWERVRVRGVSKNKILSTNYLTHTTMTKNFTNNAILRGLNNCFPQKDETKHVIVSESETIQSIVNQNQLQEKRDSLRETSCPPLAGGPKSMISRRGKINCHVKGNGNLSLNNFVEDTPLTCIPKVHFSSLRAASSPARGEEFLDANSNNSRKVAFTLAETLITLGIIGVVATLTIPTLVEKYQERLLVTSYKRVYSLLNQAHQSLIPEYGSYSDWAKTDIDNYNKFKTRLKISVDCPPNKSNNPCLTYKNIDYVDLGNNKIEGSLVSYFSDEQPAIRLVTGESIIFWSRGHLVTFVVDLNGNSKPNKLGADLHFFSFNSGKNGLAILPGPIWSNPAELQGCNSSYYWFPGSNCGYWILKYDNMKYLHMSDEEIAKNW